ncbi:MAG TPA: glycoside hydrolase family 2 TIM barrel-domain containing protein [Lacunisphaera sp.]|jgi:beta-galactosidase
MPHFFRAPIAFVFLSLLALGFGPLSAQPQDVYPVCPTGTNEARSLNGHWHFKYIAGSDLGADANFQNPAFTDTSWKTIVVPGHWELQGFAKPQYAKVDDGTGLYRQVFRVPPSWRGERIFLRFDGVLYGFHAWVNGTEIGSWASAYNPAAFDVTDALKPSGDNLLAVKVSTHSHGFEFDTNDCWALSGIYRDVTLFAVPTVHVTGFKSFTRLQPDGTVILHVAVGTSMPTTGKGILRTPDGESVGEFQFTSETDTTIEVAHPELWSAETPTLYTLELTLISGQQISEKIGLREVTIVDGVLQLNGRPVKLRGADHHDIWPVNGRVATEALMRRDLELMRAANINFIRTSHYPPHPRFLELCDEMGFYVMDEVPFGFGDEHLKDPAYQETLLTRARATVHRDRNRPCVIIWSVGNENPNTPLTFATGQEVKKLDPSRPICFPQVGSYFARSYHELPDWVDIYAPHYPEVATVARYAHELTRPVIFTEYAHALGLASDRIETEWAIMQASPRIAGGAVWMFQDQGILRISDKPVDRSAPTIDVWPDATHFFDTSGNGGMDGIVYSDRTPQTDYWEVRKAYSPVQIAARDIVIRPDEKTITVQLENRFDFRSLDGITLTWTFVRNGSPVAKGDVNLHAGSHAKEDITLQIPNELSHPDGNFDWLELHCLNEQRTSFYERTLRLKKNSTGTLHDSIEAELASGKLEVHESPDAVKIIHDTFTFSLLRKTGAVQLRDAAGTILASGFLPHAGRKFTEAERLRALKSSIWQGALLTPAEPPKIEIHRDDGGISLVISGRYPRSDAAGQSLSGTHTLRVKNNGMIEVDYDFNADAGSTGHLLEAGLAVLAPRPATEFRWVGAGPYAGYPGKEALNEFGIFHLTRDDLHFQGNRRGVELAALTRTTGEGLVILSPDPTNIAVEKETDGIVMSHNALLSGLGNKGVGPETNIAAKSAHITGHFTVVPLTSAWPGALIRWLGSPTATVSAFHPFYHSYDQ